MKLEIEEISDLRAFVFLWCGSGEGLDLGRMVTLGSSLFSLSIGYCMISILLKGYNGARGRQFIKGSNYWLRFSLVYFCITKTHLKSPVRF